MTGNLTGTVSLDKGRRGLGQLLARLSKQSIEWNEAETRFQFIDPFLTNCLGWPKSLIHVERAEGREYTDYELGEPRSIIWEAKREGGYFDLPAKASRKLICSLPSIMATSSKAANAIKQVQSYCSTRGVQLAVVCNGQQLIAFLAVRLDGQNPLDGQCLACDGYLQIKSEIVSHPWNVLLRASDRVMYYTRNSSDAKMDAFRRTPITREPIRRDGSGSSGV